MTLTMYDSVSPTDIPTYAEAVALYVDGRYAAASNAFNRFPNLQKGVWIAVSAATNAGDVLDCETGDAAPQQCAGWIRMRQDAGLAVPSIYTNRSQLPAVEAACAGMVYKLWVADWTGQPHSIPGAAAVQYTDQTMGSGGHYDLSVIYDDAWPYVATPIPPQPPRPPSHPPFPGRLLELTVPYMRGPDIQTWQAQMLRRGWRGIGAVDGIYGPKTATVCRQFQAEKGLIVDGIVGPYTWTAAWVDPVT